MIKLTDDTPTKKTSQVPLHVFLYWKVIDAPFSYGDPELAKMTKAPKQSLCQILVFIIFQYKICRVDRNYAFS